MDFDDLLVHLALLLIKSEKVRKKFAGQFRYVLVDEYQDTNKIQASIVKRFASIHKNILVVGDDAQSIYSFRGANIQNILDFENEYPGARVFRLETNYRSTPNILDVANDVIANNKKQYTKQLRAVCDPFAKPELHAFVDQQEEASFIAERILELRDEGVPMRSMAVLFRAAYHSQALEMELVKRDIPYDYRGGIRFFERAHIKDVLAYIKIVSNASDVIAWSRVLHMQVGIGPVSATRAIAAVKQLGSLSDLSTVGAVFSARGRAGWSDFLQVWKDMARAEQTASGLIRAVAQSKYTQYLENEYPDAKERLQDIEQLALFAERAPDIARFLAEASLQESYAASHVRQSGHDDEQVVLSTIHQAKGLEWDAVFVMHVSAGHFPNDRASLEDEGIDEERRLFYVAVTRAKKYLHLTYPLTSGYNQTLLGPSMFLEEMSRDLLDAHALDDIGFTDPSDDVDDVIYVAEDEPFPSTPRPGRFLKSFDEL
jgi:DNA helicase-2/ATP-dependent DNA helicase PcrA